MIIRIYHGLIFWFMILISNETVIQKFRGGGFHLANRQLEEKVSNCWHRDYYGDAVRVSSVIVCNRNEECTISQTFTHTVTSTFSIGFDLGVSAGQLWALTGIKLNFQISKSDATATSYTFKLNKNSVGALYFSPRLLEFGGYYHSILHYGHGFTSRSYPGKNGDFKVSLPVVLGHQADGKWEIKYFDVNWNQFWTWEDKGNGYFQIVNKRSFKCLEVDDKQIYTNGAVLQQWDCYNNDNQLWKKKYFKDDTFQIINKKSKRCIDIPGWRKSNGVRLWQWQCLDQANQKWESHSNGLKNSDSGKCLDLPDHESYNQGAQMQQWECNYVEKDHQYLSLSYSFGKIVFDVI